MFLFCIFFFFFKPSPPPNIHPLIFWKFNCCLPASVFRELDAHSNHNLQLHHAANWLVWICRNQNRSWRPPPSRLDPDPPLQRHMQFSAVEEAARPLSFTLILSPPQAKPISLHEKYFDTDLDFEKWYSNFYICCCQGFLFVVLLLLTKYTRRVSSAKLYACVFQLPYFMNELTLTELDMGSTTPRILRASKPCINYRGKRQINLEP